MGKKKNKKINNKKSNTKNKQTKPQDTIKIKKEASQVMPQP